MIYLVFSSTAKEHRNHLRQLSKRLHQLYGLVINATKCVLGRSQLSFIGQPITAKGFCPLPTRVQAIADFPPPANQKKLLGMVNCYHRFTLIHCSRHLPYPDIYWPHPDIYGLLKCQDAFEFFKSALVNN